MLQNMHPLNQTLFYMNLSSIVVLKLYSICKQEYQYIEIYLLLLKSPYLISIQFWIFLSSNIIKKGLKQNNVLYKGLLIAKKKIVFLEYDCAYLRKIPFNFNLHHCKMHRTRNDVKKLYCSYGNSAYVLDNNVLEATRIFFFSQYD